MIFPPRVAVLLLLATGALSAHAASATYELDPVHTRVMVAVEHAGFSRALGTVSGSSGHLEFDPDDWTTARLDVSVPLQRIDFGDGKWNQAVLAANLLDAERYPVARFVSSRVDPIDPRHASLYGTLTLHGVSREVKLEVTLNALKRHPLPPFRRTAGFSAVASLSRAEFGIDAWKSVIGDRVEVRLEVEATRTRASGDSDAEETESNEATQPPSTTEPTP